MEKQKWLKLGLIKKGKTGNKYIALGTANSKYEPVNVELVVKDANTGKVLATVQNPNLTCQDPRKRTGITESQKNNIPDFILAELSLPPAKE